MSAKLLCGLHGSHFVYVKSHLTCGVLHLILDLVPVFLFIQQSGDFIVSTCFFRLPSRINQLLEFYVWVCYYYCVVCTSYAWYPSFIDFNIFLYVLKCFIAFASENKLERRKNTFSLDSLVGGYLFWQIVLNYINPSCSCGRLLWLTLLKAFSRSIKHIRISFLW